MKDAILGGGACCPCLLTFEAMKWGILQFWGEESLLVVARHVSHWVQVSRPQTAPATGSSEGSWEMRDGTFYRSAPSFSTLQEVCLIFHGPPPWACSICHP